MSPVGDAFRRRCRMFPSLVNCCTIDWFSNWPTEALYSVALGLLQDLAKNADERQALASTTVFMHKVTRIFLLLNGILYINIYHHIF